MSGAGDIVKETTRFKNYQQLPIQLSGISFSCKQCIVASKLKMLKNEAVRF